jgi:hypothetical protein
MVAADTREEHVMLEDAITAWHDAVNRRDLAAARAAVSDPVAVGGPRQEQHITAAAFADWFIASGIRLRPLSAHPVVETTMVVEQEASWPDHPDAAAAATPATRVATLFRVHDGVVSTAHRFGSLHDALRAASPHR